ncbi:non-ribosomal peptide synthetase [Actinoplanes philippinensis]|uniref:non-ribosomal peptide synthetase n=1 Tax=Actinoplanes philippinensis TaxID=35752 RepID=UPI0033FEC5E9
MPADGVRVPLSAVQGTLWSQCRAAGAEFAVRGVAVPVPGPVPPVAEHLARATGRFPVLGKRLADDGRHWLPGRSSRLIAECPPVPSTGEDAEQWRRRVLARPVDPWRGPLVRISLARYADGVTELLVVAHAAALDAAELPALAAFLLTGSASAAVSGPVAPAGEPPAWGARTTPGPVVESRVVEVPVPRHGWVPDDLVRATGLVLARCTGTAAGTVAVTGAGTVDVTVDEHRPLSEAPIRPAAGGVGSAVLLHAGPGEVSAEVVQIQGFALEIRLTGAALRCSYRPDLVTEDAAAGVALAVAAVLRRLAGDPDAAAGTIDLTDGAASPAPPEAITGTIHDAVVRRAAAAPERVAVTCGDDSLTYGELIAGAAATAEALRSAGVAPGDRVGVLMSRSASLVTTLLGVLMSGGVYVPLDPQHPPARLRFTADDAGLICVIADRDTAGLGVPVLAPVGAGPYPPARPPAAPGDDPAAYVIYTSGSTGRPKGVVVGHRNVLALLDATSGYAFGPDDVWTLFHSYAFDFSVWEIWGCLASGGRLVVVPGPVARDARAFHRLLRTERVTVLNQTPSAFAQLLAADADEPAGLDVRLLVFGGERLDSRLLLPWFDRYDETGCRVVNMYGITETTVHCTWRTVSRSDALRGTESVGLPLPGWSIHILDAAGRELPPGVPGEIGVGGAGVATGYLNRPALTASRFVPAPRSAPPGSRLYRSGDLGRRRLDGEIEHLGRIDEQVKIRGHRVELGEIRTRLLATTDVTAAAVLPRRHDGQLFLDAYVTGRVDAAIVRRELATALPDYLMPATITVLAQLPTTVNGKLDASRLPPPGAPAPARPDQPDQPDSSPLATVLHVWEHTLGLAVTEDDNLFLVGGNSLTVQKIVLGLRNAGFGDATVRDIYRNPTPRLLASSLLAAAPLVKESR